MPVIFKFKDTDIRFINDKPVANDVALVLGYADPASTVSKKVKTKYRSVAKMETLDQKLRDVTVLEEGGIYQLVLSSKLPIAEEFQDWLFDEVLPSIRKTGSYNVKPLTPAQMLLQQAQFMVDMEQRQAALEQSQVETKAIAEQAREGLEQVRNQLASLKEFAVAQPPGLDQDKANLINQAFQLLGATLLEAGVITDKQKAYSTPWRDLGLTMRNSSVKYDLNARYANAVKKHKQDLDIWEFNGKPRGQKPKQPTRIVLMLQDNVLIDGFKAAQQVVRNSLSKLK